MSFFFICPCRLKNTLQFVYSEIVNQTGCSSSNDTLECLRAADVNSLQCANLEVDSSGFFGTFVFVPVVDGSFITERPTQLLKAGKLNGVREIHFILIHHNDVVGIFL